MGVGVRPRHPKRCRNRNTLRPLTLPWHAACCARRTSPARAKRDNAPPPSTQMPTAAATPSPSVIAKLVDGTCRRVSARKRASAVRSPSRPSSGSARNSSSAASSRRRLPIRALSPSLPTQPPTAPCRAAAAFWRLECDGAPVAAGIFLACKDHIASHIAAFDARFEKASVGMLLLERAIAEMFAEGFVTFDLLPPAATYKARLAGARRDRRHRLGGADVAQGRRIRAPLSRFGAASDEGRASGATGAGAPRRCPPHSSLTTVS